MANLPEINFPNFAGPLLTGGVKFDGFIPKSIIPEEVSVENLFQEGNLVGLFIGVSNPVGSEWGLIVGGNLTADGLINIFEKTSEDSTNIYGTMRLVGLDPPIQNSGAWKSLVENGETGWSIRTIVSDYVGQVIDRFLAGGAAITLCGSDPDGISVRLLIGPTGTNNNFFLGKCGAFDAVTGATAAIGQIFAEFRRPNTTVFNIYECIDGGSDESNPAVFTGPFEAPASYFTSTTSLTTSIECEYPYIWNWGPKWQKWRYDCTEEVWLARGASITQGGNGPQGFRGFRGLKGPTAQGEVGATGPQGFQGFQGTIGRQGFQGVQGSQGFQGVQGFQGFQGFQGRSGRQGFQGRIGLNAPSGSDRQIQYKSGSAFAADSRATVGVDNSMDLNTGYSGNFLNYSESVRVDSTAYSSNGTITLSFGSYNTYRATNISLNADATLTFGGFESAKTGETLTLILGYTGAANSRIRINGGIFWADGPLGGDGGQTTTIETSPSQKKFDTFFFINDGQRTYGKHLGDYKKE